jgi:hypothetical protein
MTFTGARYLFFNVDDDGAVEALALAEVCSDGLRPVGAVEADSIQCLR